MTDEEKGMEKNSYSILSVRHDTIWGMNGLPLWMVQFTTGKMDMIHDGLMSWVLNMTWFVVMKRICETVCSSLKNMIKGMNGLRRVLIERTSVMKRKTRTTKDENT